jgi:antitoxin component of MazEF toxin-antitoxin module
MTQKVLRVGTSAAVTIPKEALKDLGLKIGDRVRVQVDSDNISLTVTPSIIESDHLAKTRETTARFIERYRKDLEALAKK